MKHQLNLWVALVLCITFLLQPLPQKAADSVTIVNNLVLFAQFDQGEGYNFMEGRTEAIQQMCSQKDTFRSLYGYINEISYGQMQTACYFPQLDGDTIIPYTMSQGEGSYLNKEMVYNEVVRNVAVPENIPLDGNNDGIVDNIILVFDAIADSRNDMFFPCAFSLGGGKINGKSIGMVNLINSDVIFSNRVTGGVGTLCHEFLHSVGYPDLYRADDIGAPVGLWDIMSSTSVFVQYPLAYMRASVSGWLETKDITQSGSYTLAPASADSGDRVYLLKSLVSDTEFFAVEYRQKGTPYSEEMDVLIYGSGMVVYRVNTEADGNHNSDKDEIYVFRPEETELNAGEGNLSASNYGGEGSADAIGSLNLNDGIAEGALVYSDGTNSGIRIENIIMDGDTLTFDVQFAEVDAQAVWQAVSGASELNGFTGLDMAVSDNGTVYMAGSTGSEAMLYRLTEDGLTEEAVLNGNGYASINEIKLVVCGETPYLLYHNTDYNAILCSYTDGSWHQIWQSKELAQYADMTANSKNLYIGYTQGMYPYALQVCAYSPASGEITEMGGIIAENACSISAGCTENVTAFAYRDLNDHNLPKLAVWGEDGWSITAISELPCDMVNITADTDGIFITMTGQSAGICQYQDGAVSSIAYPEFPGMAFTALPLYRDGVLFTAVNTQSTSDFSLYRYDNTWNTLGNSLTDEVVNSPAIAASGDAIYLAYISSTGTVFVKSLQYTESEKENIIGDVNADGSFDVLDVICLQKWLLGTEKKLSDADAGDFDGNGILDIFDLGLMKRALLDKI